MVIFSLRFQKANLGDQLKIAVIGLGKLGLPFALLLAHAGHKVNGLDLSQSRLLQIKENNLEPEPEVANLVATVDSKNFQVSHEWKTVLADTEVSFIVVPTPSDSSGMFTNKYLVEALREIGKSANFLASRHAVCVVSTVMPGSCDNELSEALFGQISRTEDREKISLTYSPEFIALGSIVRNLKFPDLILLGEKDEWAGNLVLNATSSICQNDPFIERMSCASAEITKISINTYVTSKISYANMIAEIADKTTDANKFQILDAIGRDSRIGSKYLRPGLGFGGPCFPRDNRALATYASNLGVNASMAYATQEINLRQPEVWVDRIESRLTSIGTGKRILLLGMSYKPGSFVIEESQAISITSKLAERGYAVSAHDPLADLDGPLSGNGIEILSELPAHNEFDLVVKLVDWENYRDYVAKVPDNKLMQV
jgi:UDPglucose 6-dehydrogenase